jgi:hypothetical protein
MVPSRFALLDAFSSFGCILTVILKSCQRIARSRDVNEPDTEGNRAICVAAQNQCVAVLALLVSMALM